MKKFISGFLSGAILCGSIALAANYSALPATFKILVNGQEFSSDPPALVVEGRTYLPLQAVGDALGVPVSWNQELGQVEVGTAAAAYPEIAQLLPIAHAENDTAYWLIDDTSYRILEDSYDTLLIEFDWKENEGYIYDENNFDTWPPKTNPAYYIEKGNFQVLWRGSASDGVGFDRRDALPTSAQTEAFEATLLTAHAENDTAYWTINDDTFSVLDENEYAYLIAFGFNENLDEINALEAIDPNNPIVLYGADHAAAYIVEKGTHNILWSGPLQDYWDGMINDLLYGDGGQGSYNSPSGNSTSGLTPDPDPIEAAIAEQEAISNATSQLNPIVGSDYLYISLPSDRTEAKVSVICDGEVIYENTHNTSEGTAIVKLSGSSAIDVDIYIDDEFVSSKTIDFSNEQESNNMDIDGVQSRFSEAIE